MNPSENFLTKYNIFLEGKGFSSEKEGVLAKIREIISGKIGDFAPREDKDWEWKSFLEELKQYLSECGIKLDDIRFIPIRKSLSREYKSDFFEVLPVIVSLEGYKVQTQFYYSAIDFPEGLFFRSDIQSKIFFFGCKVGGKAGLTHHPLTTHQH